MACRFHGYVQDVPGSLGGADWTASVAAARTITSDSRTIITDFQKVNIADDDEVAALEGQSAVGIPRHGNVNDRWKFPVLSVIFATHADENLASLCSRRLLHQTYGTVHHFRSVLLNSEEEDIRKKEDKHNTKYLPDFSLYLMLIIRVYLFSVCIN